jgi:ribonucleotide monophosphatase NagD (HAD superfamily)
VLAIGDSLATDLTGAAAFGLDFLLIAGGIHRAELMPSGRLEAPRIAKLLAGQPARPVGAAEKLRW